MLKDATYRLAAQKTTAVYLDAGHSAWLPSREVASRLKLAGVGHARGFSLNVSNFRRTSEEITYGERISYLTGGKRYVIDTSRNGLGPASNAAWCNPSGRALGVRPTATTGGRHADAYLWVKHPGESDGTCGRGEPAAGNWWRDYAIGLVTRSPHF